MSGQAPLVAALRRRGHRAELRGLRVVLLLAPGADRSKAEAWARQHEQQLRAELVAEAHAAVGLARDVYQGARVREVRGADGQPLRGAIDVIAAADFEALPPAG